MELGVVGSKLSRIDVSELTSLTKLFCTDNKQLIELDLSNNTALTELYCVRNQLSELDLSNCPALTSLQCEFNFITVLDVSHNPLLSYLRCSPMTDSNGNNLLTTLYIAEGQIIPGITENRNNFRFPAETDIRIAPTNGSGEGSTTTPTEP